MAQNTEIACFIFILAFLWIYFKSDKSDNELYRLDQLEQFDQNDTYALNDAHKVLPNVPVYHSSDNKIDCQHIRENPIYTDQYIELDHPTSRYMQNNDNGDNINQIDDKIKIKEKVYVYNNDFNLSLATFLIILVIALNIF